MKINRKKFFASIGLGMTGLFLFKGSSVVKSISDISKKKLKIQPNPFAVKRDKTRVNNG